MCEIGWKKTRYVERARRRVVDMAKRVNNG